MNVRDFALLCLVTLTLLASPAHAQLEIGNITLGGARNDREKETEKTCLLPREAQAYNAATQLFWLAHGSVVCDQRRSTGQIAFTADAVDMTRMVRTFQNRYQSVIAFEAGFLDTYFTRAKDTAYSNGPAFMKGQSDSIRLRFQDDENFSCPLIELEVLAAWEGSWNDFSTRAGFKRWHEDDGLEECT